jgi:flagellar assembly protein FliH
MSGTVIKLGQTRFPSRGAYALDLRDISSRAEAMISAAQMEAERLTAAAMTEAEQSRKVIEEAAYGAGLERGLAEGREAGRAEALKEAREQFVKDQSSLTAMLGETLRTFEHRREQLYLSARRDVVVLALAVARRVVAKMPGLEEAATESAVQACAEALDLVRGASEVVIRAHPDDRRALEQLAGEVAQVTKASKNLQMVEDESVGRGGVVVQTADSEIDARAAARVERIADELVTEWRERLKALSLEQ